MRPRNIALVVGTVIAGLAIQGGFAMLVTSVMVRAHRAQNAAFVARNNVMVMQGGNVAVDEMVPVAGQQAAQPVAREELQQVRGPAADTGAYEFSGPFTHGNLSVFFIHGPDAMKDQKVITLQEAVAQNLATVHDTGFSLSVDNRSGMPLFIQGGDIVKGGNQDRVLPYDYLIPAGASRAPVAAFCVESGRSSPRGHELSSSFQVATEQLPTRQLKLAAMLRRSQTDVWNGIAQTQTNLGRNIGDVQAPQSRTSLQLTLEHPRVLQAAQPAINELSPLAQRQENAIGFVVAINGTIQSADVYASSDLFLRVWPKLLQANAVAAVAEQQAGAKFEAPTIEAVQSFLVAPEQGQAFRQTVTARVNVIRQETPQHVLFETCDAGQGNLIVHRCYLAK